MFYVSFQDQVSSNHSMKREHAIVGKKESGKLVKKAGKFAVQSFMCSSCLFLLFGMQ